MAFLEKFNGFIQREKCKASKTNREVAGPVIKDRGCELICKLRSLYNFLSDVSRSLKSKFIKQDQDFDCCKYKLRVLFKFFEICLQ